MHHRNGIYGVSLRRARLSAAFLLLTSAMCAAGGEAASNAAVAVRSQCDATHVYIAADDFSALVKRFVVALGGQASKRSLTNGPQDHGAQHAFGLSAAWGWKRKTRTSSGGWRATLAA
jgi:hypothetical protein